MGELFAHTLRVVLVDDWGFWGTIPDWIVAITAIFGVVAGLVQLGAIRRTNHQATQFERARLLLDFDRDFESAAMAASRQKLLALRNRFASEVRKSAQPLTEEQQIVEIAEKMSFYITDIWQKSRQYDGDPTADKDSSSDEYGLIMKLPYWCETLGHQCRRNLVPIDDALDLYDQLIINVIGNMANHIKLRQEEGPHKNARYLSHAVWLFERAKRYKAAATMPADPQVSPSRVGWN